LVEFSEAVNSPGHYADVLADYYATHSEDALYRASLLSRAFVEAGLGPEEIIAMHGEAFGQVAKGLGYREQARLSVDALQFLLEVMIAYGVQHREYLEMKLAQRAKAAEERAAAAERSEQSKMEAMAMIAHELRTPIAAALGNLDLVMRALQKGADGSLERLPRLIGSAREAMARLSRLSADLVEASRSDSPDLKLQPVELQVTLSQAISWAGAVAEEKEIKIVRGGGPFSLRVLADEDALLTVFGNLLSNAIRYTPPRGTVTVGYGVDTSRPLAWVEVRDTGIGISSEARERIFDKFYRAPDARAMEQQGLGLGLTLVRRLVESHGGSVELDSEPNQGSTFRVYLPLVRPETETTRTAAAATQGDVSG